MRKLICFHASILVSLLYCNAQGYGQDQFGDEPPPLTTGYIGAELSASSSSRSLPFWMRSNKSGNYGLPGLSAGLIGSIKKEYGTRHAIRFGGALTVRGSAGKGSQFSMIEGYVKLKANVFQLQAGRSRDVMGIVGDSTLSSGSFASSGNAPGIPKVQLSIPEYEYIFGGQTVAFKGTFSYGWMGKRALDNGIWNYPGQIYFHEKSLYGRLGRPDWRLNLFGGFNHQAMWGWDVQNYNDYDLSPLQAFRYAATGMVYKGSKLGNQLGSIDLGLEFEFDRVKLSAYRQFLYDVGALYHLANLRDGLNGITLTNKVEDRYSTIIWKKFLLEFLFTKNQAGELWSKITPSGDENYYNNFGSGWSYKGLGLGTPFITPAHLTREGFPNDPIDFFNNTRVAALHVGIQGQIYDWDFATKVSYSMNWGNYSTSEIGRSMGVTRTPPMFGIFQKVNQFSGYFELNGHVDDNVIVGGQIGIDLGRLYYNNVGISVSIKRTF